MTNKLRCVPVPPTSGMVAAGIDAWNEAESSTAWIITKAIAAAPPPPADIAEALRVADSIAAMNTPDNARAARLLVDGKEILDIVRALRQSWGRE